MFITCTLLLIFNFAVILCRMLLFNTPIVFQKKKKKKKKTNSAYNLKLFQNFVDLPFLEILKLFFGLFEQLLHRFSDNLHIVYIKENS